jgi:hypothetical protein
MSDKSQEILLGQSVIPPERLDEDEDRIIDRTDQEAEYESNVIDILDHVGTTDFKFVYLDFIPQIKRQKFDRKRRFVQKLLEKIAEVYDFEFPYEVELDTKYEIDEMLLFVEFLEFDNIRFLSYVWGFLKQDLIRIDIWDYCQKNDMRIIKEVDEQLDTHPQSKWISKFLRTYYKEKFIEWFATNSEQSKVEIQLEIYEREGKLNG